MTPRWWRWLASVLAAFVMPWRAVRQARQAEQAALFMVDVIIAQHGGRQAGPPAAPVLRLVRRDGG